VPATGYFTVGMSSCLALNNGVNSGAIDLVTNEPIMGWIDGPYVSLSNFDPSRGWISPAYDHDNFTASGSTIWDVGQADVATYAYTLLNKTMTVSFTLNGTSVGGTPGYVLKIKIPNGKISTKAVNNMVRLTDNLQPTLAWAYTDAGGTTINIQRLDYSTFSPAADTTTVQGQITLEVN
jgi:hypothetical protein